MMDSKFTTIRVPLEVRDQAEELQKQLQQREDLKWIGTIALGAVLAYALTKMLEEERRRR